MGVTDATGPFPPTLTDRPTGDLGQQFHWAPTAIPGQLAGGPLGAGQVQSGSCSPIASRGGRGSGDKKGNPGCPQCRGHGT